LGSHRFLERKGIYPFSRQNLELALQELKNRFEQDLLQ
jgi:hypothetical protein